MKVFGPIFGFGVLLLAAPIVAGALHVDLPTLGNMLMLSFGVLLVLISGIALVVTRLYVKARADEAFVKTGMGGPKVIVDGGALVLPVIHDLVRVSLRTLRLQVTRTGTDALITADKLRADVKAEFYVRVPSEQESIINAARSLGERLLNPSQVKELVEDKLVSALRTVAAKTTLEELNSERDKFMREVIGLITGDLAHNGLVLETATISALDQTDTKSLSDGNIFDAQGKKTIAEMTQRQLSERNKLEREGEQTRAAQDLETRKRILGFEQERALAEASQKSTIAQKQAEQAQIAEQANIAKQQAVEVSTIGKAQALEVAEQAQQRAVAVAERERLEAEALADQKVEVALRKQKEAIAQAEAQQAKAEAEQLLAQAEAEKARQSVETVKVVALAEREKQRGVVAAQGEAEKAFLAIQRKADADAYGQEKQAAGRKAAADADAEAITKKAEADAKAITLKAGADKAAAIARAEGKRAEEMIPADVQARLVDVKAKEVEVEKARVAEVLVPELQARKEHGDAAQAFELGKARIVTVKFWVRGHHKFQAREPVF